MKKVFSNIVFVIYLIIAVFTTICLLSYNDYKITEFGDYSLIIITDKKKQPDYNKGDLVIVEKSDEIEAGDRAFYYDTYSREIKVELGEMEKVEKTSDDIYYTIDDGEHRISYEYVIGPEENATVIPKVGTILKIIESKWGFLFLIVFPALLAFVNQGFVVVSGIKEAKEEKEDEESK